MITETVHTGKVEITAVLLPEKAKNPRLKSGDFQPTLVWDASSTIHDWAALPTGEHRILGLLQDLTEEQCREIADKANDQLIDVDDSHWRNYLKDSWEESVSTARKSINTLAEKHKWFVVNPLGEEPKYKGRWVDKEGIDNDYRAFQQSKPFKQWQEHEKRTGSWLILVNDKKHE